MSLDFHPVPALILVYTYVSIFVCYILHVCTCILCIYVSYMYHYKYTCGMIKNNKYTYGYRFHYKAYLEAIKLFTAYSTLTLL